MHHVAATSQRTISDNEHTELGQSGQKPWKLLLTWKDTCTTEVNIIIALLIWSALANFNPEIPIELYQVPLGGGLSLLWAFVQMQPLQVLPMPTTHVIDWALRGKGLRFCLKASILLTFYWRKASYRHSADVLREAKTKSWSDKWSHIAIHTSSKWKGNKEKTHTPGLDMMYLTSFG